MNLVIDIGNTRTKLAVFSTAGLLEKWTVQKSEFSTVLTSIKKDFPKIDSCIVSAVGSTEGLGISVLKEKYNFISLSAKTKVPFTNKYGTPKTLGADRIALISAAAVKYPQKNVLVIDAGSCVTYDFLDLNNRYLGGAISPGLQMRFNALHDFTAKLPLLRPKPTIAFLGSTTIAAMHSGVVLGLAKEVAGFVATYAEKYRHLHVVLTGGDALFLRDHLKNHIFANLDFLLEGLHYIVEHNKQ
ncbi:MAG: type III pantothenate kinase [Marinirhabdus sp.]